MPPPPPPPCNQLIDDDVRTVEAELLYGKVLCLSVEDRNTSAMSAWNRCRCHPKVARLLHINYVDEFGFLQYTTINLYCTIPLSADSRYPFLPLRILYVPNLTIFSGLRQPPRTSLVRPSVGTHIPYHREIFSPSLSDPPFSPNAGRSTSNLGPAVTVLSGWRTHLFPF